MSRVLCTFSGKYGDALWSLPTVREIAWLTGGPVDFYVMPYYLGLVPLLAQQPYIQHVGVFQDWMRTHSQWGDQPWQPPKHWEQGYDSVWHLGYRGHPGLTAPDMPLVDFIAYQVGIKLRPSVVPFLEVRGDGSSLAVWMEQEGTWGDVLKENRMVAIGFNDQYEAEKKEFYEELWLQSRDSGLEFFDVGKVGWKEAAWVIQHSMVFVGCRSANWVVANGVGKETITFEPHAARHRRGTLGKVFGCPYGQETALPFGMPGKVAAQACCAMLKAKMDKQKEVVAS